MKPISDFKLFHFIFAFICLIINDVHCNDISCDKVPIHIHKITDIINIHSGPIQGNILSNRLGSGKYSSFKGIPYAEPPLGKKRFLPPTDIKPWTDLLKAYKHGNICPQFDDIRHATYLGSEDCLYLNVYTPVLDFGFNKNSSIPHPKKAVMVWIHGGAFLFGSGNSKQYGPDFLLAEDVILVTFNYRLGAIGFMNLNNTMVPGNAGLKDQQLALKWVKRNIAKFGGDVDRITIVGQSAGGASVDLHLIAEGSRNLFTRSVSLSGSAFCHWAFTNSPMKNAKRLAEDISGCSSRLPCNYTKIFSEFENIDVKTLTKHAYKYVDANNMELPFPPSIEHDFGSGDTFLNECYLNKFLNGDFHKGEHMMGYTNKETNIGGRIIETILDKFHSTLNWPGKAIFKMNNFTPITTLCEAIRTKINMPLIDRTAYELFEEPIDMKHRIIQKHKNMTTYYYLFEYEEQNRNLMTGAAHTDDLRYIFLHENTNQICSQNSTNNDVYVRNSLVKMLTNFIKYGKPFTAKLPWKSYEQSGEYLRISKQGQLEMVKGRPIDNKFRSFNRVNEFKTNESCGAHIPTCGETVLYSIPFPMSLPSPLNNVFKQICNLKFSAIGCLITNVVPVEKPF